MVFITSHLSGYRKIFIVRNQHLDNPLHVTCQDILLTLNQKEGTSKDVYLTCEGKPVHLNDTFIGNVNIVATLQLKGGKGGFGSMLRAIGAQIEKTTNREACRDLSGRRLRDINEEKRLKDFLAKKVEKEKETLEIKRKKLEQLKEGTKHMFEDKGYFEQREKRERDIYESLDKAFSSAGTSKSSCNISDKEPEKKIKKKLMLDDLDESSDSDSEEDSEEGRIKDSKLTKDSKEEFYEIKDKLDLDKRETDSLNIDSPSEEKDTINDDEKIKHKNKKLKVD